MKNMMKKIAAILMASLMMIQIIPALGETYSSGMIVGSPEGYKEALDIIATKGRASYLGERSLGHQDPGAASSLLMLQVLEAAL